MSFDYWFESGQIGAVSDGFGEWVPEGGGGNGKCSVAPGPVLGSEWCWQEVGIRGTEGAGRSVMVEQICEVGGGLVMEGFVSEEKEFELDALWDREPVEVLEDRGDVVTGTGMGEQTGSRVLNVLEFIEDFGWWAVENAVAVVNSGSDESVDESFGSREGEWWAETSNIFEVGKGSPGDVVDVVFEGEVAKYSQLSSSQLEEDSGDVQWVHGQSVCR